MCMLGACWIVCFSTMAQSDNVKILKIQLIRGVGIDVSWWVSIIKGTQKLSIVFDFQVFKSNMNAAIAHCWKVTYVSHSLLCEGIVKYKFFAVLYLWVSVGMQSL